MDELMQEYGGSLLGIIGGLTVIGIVSGFCFSGGKLADLLTLLGEMAC